MWINTLRAGNNHANTDTDELLKDLIHPAWNLSGGFEILALRRKVSSGGFIHADLSTDVTTSAGFEDEGEVDAGGGVWVFGPNTGTETLLSSADPVEGIKVLVSGCTESEQGFEGRGARWRKETESSRPQGYLTLACVGEQDTNSTSSTRGSYLDLLTCRLTRTGPFCNSQDGNEGPDAVRRANENNRSCGVSLVAVQRRERWLCSTTGMTCSQWVVAQFLESKANSMPFQITPL